MPARGTSLQNGKRFNTVNRDTWNRFQEETGIKIDYETWVTIIHTGNERYASKIQNNATGVKFPEHMGYAGTTRYKPKAGTRRVDWKKSKELGVRVYHTNFHSQGYESRIVWLTDRDSSCKFLSVYKLVPDRKLSRGTAPLIKEGKIYNELSQEHFRMGRIRININGRG